MTCFAVCAAMRPKFVGRDVGALDLLLGDLRPVEVEVVVGDEGVRALAGLGLERLELVELALARLVQQPLLEVGRDLDREDAEVAVLRRARRRRAGPRPASSCTRRAARPRAPRPACRSRCPSRARSRESASMISWLIALPLVDQVAPHDGVVRDVHFVSFGREPERALARRDDLRRGTCRRPPMSRRCAAPPAARPRCGSAPACAAAARPPGTRRRPCTCRGSRAAASVTRAQSAWSTPAGGRRRRRSASARAARRRAPRCPGTPRSTSAVICR